MLTFDILDSEVVLKGRFDAAQVESAMHFFKRVSTSMRVDLSRLEYISSAGLGVLLVTQKRLMDSGFKLRLVNVNKQVLDVLLIAGMDYVFEIES